MKLGLILLLAVPLFAQKTPEFSVLVFSKTAGFRHGSIPAGITAITRLGFENNFGVTATEDATQFNDQNLAQYQAIVFLNTTGDVLDETQQAAFERFIRAGGGFVGVHSATDTEYDWPFYGRLVAAYFKNHPAVQPAEVRVVARDHPSTRNLPEVWTRTDEWYNFRAPLPSDVRVLAEVNKASYKGGEMSGNHPVSWCQDFEGGRVWYTAMGHTDESYTEPLFINHLLGGIRSVVKSGKGCLATEPSPPPTRPGRSSRPQGGRTR